MDTSHDGRWLALPQAAVELGISPRTLRRRVKDGGVQARLVPSAHGPRYEVWVATNAPLEPRTLEVASHDQPDVASLAVLIEKLVTDNQHWMERAIRAEERLLALQAPAVEAVEAIVAPPEVPSAPIAQPRRAWWRFWR